MKKIDWVRNIWLMLSIGLCLAFTLGSGLIIHSLHQQLPSFWQQGVAWGLVAITALALLTGMVAFILLWRQSVYRDEIKDSAVLYERGALSQNKEVDINDLLARLEKDSVWLTKAVETVKCMSEQTHLLAFNAAVEGARMGTAGQGYAFVGREVMNLAYRTEQSINEFHQLIAHLQKEMHQQAGAESLDDIAEQLENLLAQFKSPT